nr:hypothetical protein [uncultured Campylobacter sp.]
MSVKIVKFHRMRKRGETSKFDQNLRLHGAAKARTASFKFSRSAKLRYGENFKFSRAIKYELNQTAHLKSTPKGRAPYALKSRCNEARCENTLPRHTQRTEKNLPKRGKSRAIKILPRQYTVKFRYKDRCGEPKCYAQQAVNFINLADQGLGCELKFNRAMNRVASQARCARQGVAMNFKFCGAASYKFNQTARHMAAPKQHIWHFAEIPSRRRVWQTAEILSQRHVRQKIEISSQQYVRRSMRQTAEISPRQHMPRTAGILQDHSLPRAAKILLLRYMHGAEIVSAQTMKILLFRHVPQAEIARAENRRNFNAMRRAESRRNFIEIARMMNHQIPAENNKTLADSRKIPNKSCREISAERGAAR